MSTLYSRQLLFTYMSPGFASYAMVPADEEWVIKDVLIQFQGTGGDLLDLAVFDGTNWGSLFYDFQAGAQLDYNLHGLYVCVEAGQTIVASITGPNDVAVLLSGFRLRA